MIDAAFDGVGCATLSFIGLTVVFAAFAGNIYTCRGFSLCARLAVHELSGPNITRVDERRGGLLQVASSVDISARDQSACKTYISIMMYLRYVNTQCSGCTSLNTSLER